MAGCGSKFEPFITTDLLQLIFTSLGHANRFVRETGFKVISAIVKCPGLSEATTTAHWLIVAENLARGLADNWSQVRTCTCMYNTVVSRISTHGHLNITHKFGPHGRLPGIKNSVCLYRSCYIDPLKWGTWALTWEWALAWIILYSSVVSMFLLKLFPVYFMY